MTTIWLLILERCPACPSSCRRTTASFRRSLWPKGTDDHRGIGSISCGLWKIRGWLLSNCFHSKSPDTLVTGTLGSFPPFPPPTTEKAAGGVVLMDVVKSTFACYWAKVIEIPYIELEGTIDNWRTLSFRVTRFANWILTGGSNPLQKILKQFVAAFAGQVDLCILAIHLPHPISRRSRVLERCSVGSRSCFATSTPAIERSKQFAVSWLTDPERPQQMLHPEDTVKQLAGDRFLGFTESAMPSGLTRVPFNGEICHWTAR